MLLPMPRDPVRTEGPPHAQPKPRHETLASRLRRRFRVWWPAADVLLRRRRLVAGLRRLADTMQETPLAGRFWIVGGLLLGWAREGRPLDSDLHDADLAYLDEDHDRFLATVPALVRAGFRPRHRFTSHDGRHVEHRFRRDGVQYDFFRLTPAGDRFRYSLFIPGDTPQELIAEVPLQPRVPFRFVGRVWMKVADHDLALRTIYGDWRRENVAWTFEDDGAVVERVALAPGPIDWDGGPVAAHDGRT